MTPLWTRAVVGVLLATSARCAAAGLPMEPYMVLSREAELYDGDHLVLPRLYAGDILLARPHELHRDTLEVSLDRRALHTKAAHCARLSDLLASYARRSADLLSRVETLGRDITARDSAAAQLYAAEVAIRFDATVQYRYREPLPPPPAQNTAPPSPPPPPAVLYVERYEDKVSPARARHLAARWARERRRAENEADRLRQQRRDQIQEQHAVEAQRAYTDWRFQTFRPQNGVSAPEPYVAVTERTPLFADTVLTQELSAATVVLATSNRQDDQWLKVLWNGLTLDAPRSHFLDRLGVERQFGGRAAWLEQAIRDATDQQDALASRRQLLDAVGLAADYASQLDYSALHAYPFAPSYPGQRYYAPPNRPPPATEVVNRSRARSLLKDCDRDSEDIEDDLQDIDRTLRSWRREHASIAPRLDDLRRRLDRAY